LFNVNINIQKHSIAYFDCGIIIGNTVLWQKWYHDNQDRWPLCLIFIMQAFHVHFQAQSLNPQTWSEQHPKTPKKSLLPIKYLYCSTSQSETKKCVKPLGMPSRSVFCQRVCEFQCR